MDAPPIADPVAQMPDASDVLATDLPCRRCGYNLRGLQTLGLCPECGSPVGLSTSGDLLRFADPNWVSKLALGTKYILWGIGLTILGAICGSILAATGDPVAGHLVSFAGGLLSVYGAWLLTEPDPSGIGEERYANTRKVIRLALAVGLLSSGMKITMRHAMIPPGLRVPIGFVIFLAALIGIAGEFAKLKYLETLAKRIPERACADRALFLRWAYVGTLLILLLARVGLALAGPRAFRGSSPGGALIGTGCVIPILGLALLVFALMYIRLVTRLRREFAAQAGFARQTWASAVAPSQT